MILELDCGNTLIKWRLMDRGGRIRDGDMAPDLVELQQLLGGQEREIHGCRLVSVRSADETQLIVDQLTSWLKRRPLVALPARTLNGVRNGYTDYQRLGMDRWLALVAGYALAGRACIVIDLGTAVTSDLVDDEGRHLGGFIAPGSKLLRSALLQHTRLIRYEDKAAWDLVDPSPGMNTAEAVECGCGLMLSGFVQEQLRVARRLLGDDPAVILTGGDAQAVVPLMPEGVRVVPDLVFRGLALACPMERDE
ncbi:type III pantothenate kinase [Halopseudomonas pertucinogena]|uniref:Type III pantothenate kinase n=1 Tax=Halopseudomonas pertucinogena TaxID=86175 RepID=A0ABQ2CTH7_9GAMM|nr:type III pantothenate kinase [Halopseudomonas pertucinogena]GGJ09849.1 type III pantothenate kinase [Halopseudomonas pertucinogena]